jgi:Mrp family chromosome partitioning ATPase/capsular polysaccharide biosynthesis protein
MASPDHTAGEETVRADDLVDLLRRRWWVLLLALALGTAAGWYAGDRQPPAYTATTQVLVRPIEVAGGPARVNLDTEAQLVMSVRTADRARSGTDLGLTGPELVERVEVHVPPNTEVLEISFTAGTPGRAAQGAAAVARAYLDQRTEEAEAAVAERVSALAGRIDTLRADDAADQVIAVLEGERALLEATPVHAGEVISPATRPASPTAPNLMLYRLSGLVAGLLLGLSAALLIHRLDNRVTGRSALPAPLAAQVRLDLTGRRPRPAVAGAATPLGRQFTRFRAVLRAGAPQRSTGAAQIWLTCPTRPGAGAGLVTANLAAALARSGDRVVVVATDPGSSVLAALGVSSGLGVIPGRRHGLADVLDGSVPPTEALVPAGAAPGVSVLPPGRLDPTTELPVADTTGVVSQLASVADHLLLETPPLSRTADAVALARIGTAVLLVVDKRRTRLPEVVAAVRDLTRAGAVIAGIVLVPHPRRLRPIGRWPVPRWLAPRTPAAAPSRSAALGRPAPGDAASAYAPARSAPENPT